MEFACPKIDLARLALKSLKSDLKRVVLIDRTGLKRTVYTAQKLLTAALFLAGGLRKLKEPRIGVLFPPSGGGAVANLATILAGKSPVNLNFTASRNANLKALELSGVKTILTAAPLREKFKDFPWEGLRILDFTEIFGKAGLGTKLKLIATALATILLPQAGLEAVFGVTRKKLEDEATLLFSSGSTGTPKGIALTHGNIVANVAQIEAIDLLPKGSKVLASLPIFHSFGLTVTLWYPLTHRVTAVSYPTPLDLAAIGKVTREESVDVLVGTASFYKMYMKAVPKEDFVSLKYVVAGAEKTPKGLHEAWEKHFGSIYLEGYGLTETSPVTNVNLPGKNRVGSVGKSVPGLETRIVSIDTREVIETPDTRGVIEFKGPNVFGGYLRDEALSAEVLWDGWFHTGDLGSLSADGYLTVDGRLRRFSKMAGEMVPHGAVEEAINRVWGLEGAPLIAVTGIRDEQKGESLVLLSSIEIKIEELREKLQAEGLPNLWIPKKIVRVEKIPLLPTGKLDIQGLEKAAKG